MRVLVLILYSEDIPFYKEMKDILLRYYSQIEDTNTIFYIYDNNINQEYHLEDNILRIKGIETDVPGILNKTVKAFEYIINEKIIDDYDYIFRTNISTIVNFNLLKKRMINIPLYGGVNTLRLSWLDKNRGITSHKWRGLNYVSGSCIIFTKEGIKYVVDNQHLLEVGVIDDVAIGILFSKHKNIKPVSFAMKTWNINKNYMKEHNNIYLFFRNKRENRALDVENMNKIINGLME